jgi:hypothetical protein
MMLLQVESLSQLNGLIVLPLLIPAILCLMTSLQQIGGAATNLLQRCQQA